MSLRHRLTHAIDAVGMLRDMLAEIADEIADLEDQAAIVECRAQWQKLVIALADAALEADEKF